MPISLRQSAFYSKNNFGREKKSFEIIKENNNEFKLLRGVSNNKDPSIFHIEEKIKRINNDGKIYLDQHAFKIKSNDLKKIILDSTIHKLKNKSSIDKKSTIKSEVKPIKSKKSTTKSEVKPIKTKKSTTKSDVKPIKSKKSTTKSEVKPIKTKKSTSKSNVITKKPSTKSVSSKKLPKKSTEKNESK